MQIAGVEILERDTALMCEDELVKVISGRVIPFRYAYSLEVGIDIRNWRINQLVHISPVSHVVSTGTLIAITANYIWPAAVPDKEIASQPNSRNQIGSGLLPTRITWLQARNDLDL